METKSLSNDNNRKKLYNGDRLKLFKTGSAYEQQFYDYIEWDRIDNIMLDLELISKGLTDKNYIQKTIKRIEDHCDKKCFEELTKRIIF